ncbi:hypothetical protein LCGC14_2582750, partial [marine sediment metagenome]
VKIGKNSHIAWALIQRGLVSKGKPEIENVGSAEHHDEQIETYNWVLFYLTEEGK